MTTSQPVAVFGTNDTFVGCVPLPHSKQQLIIHRREHGARKFARWRVFHQHQTTGVWYPGRRAFQIAVERAKDLGDALYAVAAEEEYSPKPDWYDAFTEQYVKLGKSPAG